MHKYIAAVVVLVLGSGLLGCAHQRMEVSVETDSAGRSLF